MPPRLSARALFWWGVGLMVVTYVVTRVLWRLSNAVAAEGVQALLVEVAYAISTTTTIAYSVAAALIGAAFVVRALEPAARAATGSSETATSDVEH